MTEFDRNEQAMIQKAKDLESDAKDLRRRAEAFRQDRVQRELQMVAQQEDRVFRFMGEFSALLNKYDFKVEDPKVTNPVGSPPVFVLVDSISNKRTQVIPVAGHGFKWTVGK